LLNVIQQLNYPIKYQIKELIQYIIEFSLNFIILNYQILLLFLM